MCLSLNEKKHDCVIEMLFLFVWRFQTNCRGYKKDVSCVFEVWDSYLNDINLQHILSNLFKLCGVFSLKYCSACTSDQQGALTETHCKEVYEILMFFFFSRKGPTASSSCCVESTHLFACQDRHFGWISVH